MIRILYPVNELKIGGAEQQLLEIVRGLDKRRFFPIVAPLYPNGAMTDEFRAVPGAAIVELHRRGKYDPSPLVKIARILRERQIDVVQPFLSPATFFGLAPAIVMKTPVKIVTERCGVRNVRRLGYHAYRLAEDQLTHFAEAVVANSEAGRQLLTARGISPSKIDVVYNGINLERLTPDPSMVRQHRLQLGVPDGGHVVGILASLTAPKGHDTFLRAAALVVQKQPRTRFAIVGDGPLRASLTALAADLGIQEQVVFFGYQRGVADLLAAFDVLVSSSRDNEGCSNSVLEAMALRVPVVAADIGGNRELVKDGETGFLVPVDDPVAFASAIERALSDAADAAGVTERAQEMVTHHFALSHMVRSYEALYIRLLEGTKRVPDRQESQFQIGRQGASDP